MLEENRESEQKTEKGQREKDRKKIGQQKNITYFEKLREIGK